MKHHRRLRVRRCRLALCLLLLAHGQARADDLGGHSPAAADDNDRVDIHADDEPLEDLLSRVARQAAVELRVTGDLSGARYSGDIDDVDLRHAVVRLLSDRSYTLIESRAPGTAQRTFDIRLLGARDTATPVVTASASLEDPRRVEERSVDELLEAVSSTGSRSSRAAAIDAVAYAAAADPARAVAVEQALIELLSDTDATIRSQALQTLKDTADDAPPDAVEQLAREDPSPALRVQALEWLAERNEERALAALHVALADPEASVRERAGELVEDLR
jgi:hypothetical protein